jgi:hypothetical protein
MNESLNFEETPEELAAPFFDPFPEPQTIPKGWDLSGLISPPRLFVTEPANDVTDC